MTTVAAPPTMMVTPGQEAGGQWTSFYHAKPYPAEASSEKRRVACHAVVLETFRPHYRSGIWPCFPWWAKLARQQMGAGRRTCHVLTTCQTPSS